MSVNFANLLGVQPASNQVLYDSLSKCASADAAVQTLNKDAGVLGNVIAHLPLMTSENEELYEKLIGSVTPESRANLPADAVSRVRQIKNTMSIKSVVKTAYSAFGPAVMHKLMSGLTEVVKQQMKDRPIANILTEAKGLAEAEAKAQRARFSWDDQNMMSTIMQGIIGEPIETTRAHLTARDLPAFERSLEDLLLLMEKLPPEQTALVMQQVGDIGGEVGSSFIQGFASMMQMVDKGQTVPPKQVEQNREFTKVLLKLQDLGEAFGLQGLHTEVQESMADAMRKAPKVRFASMTEQANLPDSYRNLMEVMGLMQEILDDPTKALEPALAKFEEGAALLQGSEGELKESHQTDLVLDACKAVARAQVNAAVEHIRPTVGDLHLNLNNEADRAQRDRIEQASRILPGLVGLEVELEMQMQVEDDRLLQVLMVAGFDQAAIDAWRGGLVDEIDGMFEEWIGLNLDAAQIQPDQFPTIADLYGHFRQQMYGEGAPPPPAVAGAAAPGMEMNEANQMVLLALMQVFPDEDQGDLEAWIAVNQGPALAMFPDFVQQNQIGPGVFDTPNTLFQAYQAMMGLE